MFYFTQHKIDLYEKYDGLRVSCYSCGKINHVAKNCPDIHVIIESVDVAENAIKLQENTKKNFRRENFKVQKNRMKSFNARGDFTTIREEALVFRKCLLIIPDKIKKNNIFNKDNSQNNSSNRRHFHSLIVEDEDDDFDTEDVKEFEPNLSDKMKTEIVNYPKKGLNFNRETSSFNLEENLMREKSPLISSHSSSIQISLNQTFKSATNKIIDKLDKSPNRNFDKNLLLNELTCVKYFDKIHNFTSYFPNNNFEIVVSKLNKKSEEILTEIKNKKIENEKKKKVLLETVIDQPVSSPNWRNRNNDKTSTRNAKRGKLFLNNSNEIGISEDENKEIILFSNIEVDLEETNQKLSEKEKNTENKVLILNETEENLIKKTIKEESEKILRENSIVGKLMKRSYSNDSLDEPIKTLKQAINNSQKLLGSEYTNFLVEKFKKT